MVPPDGQLHPTGRGLVVEGVDAEGAVPPPSVVFLHVVAIVRGVGNASEQIPGEWAQWFLQMDSLTWAACWCS